MSSPATIAITLTPPPSPPANLIQNGTVWVAACALLGVIITVLAAHMRMRSELAAAANRASAERDLTRDQARLDREEAATQAHKERISTARREVYLEAATALAKAQHFLGSLTKHNLSDVDYASHLGPLASAVNKIATVGELETVTVARELLAYINLKFIEAAADLLPMGVAKGELEYHVRQLEDAQLEVKRILQAMQNHNEARVNDRGAFEALTTSFNFHQARAKAEAQETALRHQKIADLQMQYMVFAIDTARDINLQFDTLADSIRREMGIAADLETLKAQSLSMWESVTEARAHMARKLEEFAGKASEQK